MNAQQRDATHEIKKLKYKCPELVFWRSLNTIYFYCVCIYIVLYNS
jgi:hypothetical protein